MAFGGMMSYMVSANNHGPMEVNMKETSKKVINTAMADTFGLMAANTQANGSTAPSQARAELTGRTDESMTVSGLTTKSMERVFTPGLMVANMKEIMNTIRDRV